MQIQGTRSPQKTNPVRVTPAPQPSQESNTGIIDEYISDVRQNFKQNGPVGVLIGAGIEGMMGGYMARFAGNLVSGFFPGPVGAAIGEYAGAVGATLGIAHGLSNKLF